MIWIVILVEYLIRGNDKKFACDKVGVTPVKYITRLKIEKAQVLLRETDIKIKDIAFGLGYEDPFYFSAVFKKYEGISPENYRKKTGKQ